MNWPPILERELRVAARRPKTYRTRWLAGAGALLLGGGMVTAIAWFGAPGFLAWQAMFALATAVFFVCLLAGSGPPSDALSLEKREGTLGLLFLTHLKSRDIVVGKLAAASLHTLYGLLATFPVFALVLLAGSVQASHLVRLFLALLNTLFFSLAAGLFASSVCRRQQPASYLAASILLLSWIVPGGLSVWLRDEWELPGAAEVIAVFSPQAMIGAIFRIRGDGVFWSSWCITHLAGWGLLILACRILPRSWQDKTAPAETKAPPASTRRNRTLRRRWLDEHPTAWLTLRMRSSRRNIWIAHGMILLLAATFGAIYLPTMDWAVLAIWTAIFLHAVTKFDLCATAARWLVEERHFGSIELLVTTPLRTTDILRGQWRMLWFIYRWPVLFVAGVDLLALLAVFLAGPDWHDLPGGFHPAAVLIVGGLLFAASQALDLVALGWLGTWAGLSSRNRNQGASSAAAIVLILPWGILMGGMTVLGLWQPPWFLDLGPWPFAVAWLLLGLVVDTAAIVYARRRLLRDFRPVAAIRHAPEEAKPWWKRLFLKRTAG